MAAAPKKDRTATTPPDEKDEFDFAPAWQPDPGDIIRGKVIGLDMGHSDYGAYPIVTLMTEDQGERAIHAFHEALRNKLSDVKPTVGDEIAIKFFGEVESKSGRQKYMKYIVKAETVPSGFWDTTSTRPADDVDEDDIPF